MAQLLIVPTNSDSKPTTKGAYTTLVDSFEK